ncbi:hypothetical protein DL764_006848 [Monosporascus ibericus]|uniref:Uncharacterized protein n=1 Tax=Monosporascus ibericus TaxID=155417 RepID=A0A4Q4T6S3_9PEZI|nr:hypothetical protein DL764_006848 [Monosporascus ibericus]
MIVEDARPRISWSGKFVTTRERDDQHLPGTHILASNHRPSDDSFNLASDTESQIGSTALLPNVKRSSSVCVSFGDKRQKPIVQINRKVYNPNSKGS